MPAVPVSVLLVLTVSVTAAVASPGDLNPNFGTGGKAIVQLSNAFDPLAATTDSAGRILFAGAGITSSGQLGVSVVRMTSNGKLDTAFGVGGREVFSFGKAGVSSSPLTFDARSMTVAPNGKIVVGGVTVYDQVYTFAAFRLHPDGTIDSSFGANGRVVIPNVTSTGSTISAVRVFSDYKVLLVGVAEENEQQNIQIVRLDSDGSLDGSFGSGGMALFTMGDGVGAAAVALPGGEKFVVAGSAGGSFMVARFNADGTLDHTFGTDGTTEAAFGETHVSGCGGPGFDSVRIQSGGKIVAAGNAPIAGGCEFVIGRFGSNGAPDSSFGQNGYVTTPVSGSDTLSGIAVDGTKRVVAAGTTQNPTAVILMRYAIDGSVDSTFGNNGVVATPFDTPGLETVRMYSGMIDVAGGVYRTGGGTAFGSLQYLS